MAEHDSTPVFVTGGTGLIGVNLVRTLVEQGHAVRLLVRPQSPRIGLDLDAIEFITGDVTDIDSLRRGMEGCKSVYHLAGWVQITPWGGATAMRVNVGGTENVCRVACERGVDRLVHTSSIAAVGHGPLDAPATEESAWNLGHLKAPYYNTKRRGEEVVRRYIENGLDAVIVNPAYVVGPYDIKPSGGRMIIQIATRRLRGVPSRGGICFVDVREVVDGMLAAMERGVCGERYILGNENITYRDYARRVAGIAGVEPPTWAMPYWLLSPAAAAATAIGWFNPKPFADANLTVLRIGFCEHFLSGEKARRELGVSPRPIDTAIADAIAWFEEHGYLVRSADGWRSVPPGPHFSVRRGKAWIFSG